jgi:hypothetical protein
LFIQSVAQSLYWLNYPGSTSGKVKVNSLPLSHAMKTCEWVEV